MTLEWTAAAIRHLYALHEYILDKNPSAADRVVQRITDLVSRLPESPGLGRPGRLEGTRELVIPQTPYIVAYVVRSKAIRVLAVIHGKQRWPAVIESK